MSTIQPKGEALRRAVRFVSERLSESPEQALAPLIDRATLEFDLDPNQSEYLTRFYREARAREESKQEDSK